jgi:hypothetical protein
MLRKSTISYLAIGKYVRMFVVLTKEIDGPLVRELEDDFSLDERIALVF